MGVKSVSVEIYDECSLTMDELVAYSHIELPDALFQNHLVDEWFQLSGKQGDNKEGSIHLVLSLLVCSCFLGYQSLTKTVFKLSF